MFLRLSGKKSLQRTDEELLSRFITTGNMEVLGELYSRYMHLVYGVCLKYLKNRDESMDATMQIFEKLVKEVPKHEIGNFKSWLHVVTRNYCLMELRSVKNREEKMQVSMNDTVFMEIEQVLHPVDEDEPGIDKRLMECIEKLKGEQKECVKQFYFGNKCYADIAVSMRADEKSIKSWLQNAKRNLKICMEKSNEED